MKVSRRSFFKASAMSSAALVVSPSVAAGSREVKTGGFVASGVEKEWRNRQEGMRYRMLGRTGLMVSELGLGTFPFDTPDELSLVEAAVERGINYLDTAQAYSQGGVEKNLGEYLKHSSKREKVFLTTKLSNYYVVFNHYIREIEKGLPAGKKEALKKKSAALIEERRVLSPGYHFMYFQGQLAQVENSYYKHLLLKEYGYRSGVKNEMKKHARSILGESLSRLQTDHIDVLFCPHGVAMPEFLEDEVIREMFDQWKQEGLIKASAVSFHNDITGNLLKAAEVGHYDVAMFAYNIANHAALEHAMYKAQSTGMGLLAMKVVKLIADPGTPDWILEKLDASIPGDGLSPYAKSYTWALQNPNLTACVSQMESEEEMDDNLQAVAS